MTTQKTVSDNKLLHALIEKKAIKEIVADAVLSKEVEKKEHKLQVKFTEINHFDLDSNVLFGNVIHSFHEMKRLMPISLNAFRSIADDLLAIQ